MNEREWEKKKKNIMHVLCLASVIFECNQDDENMCVCERESGRTWFAQDYSIDDNDDDFFSMYVNTVDCAPFSFSLLRRAFFFSDSWLLFFSVLPLSSSSFSPRIGTSIVYVMISYTLKTQTNNGETCFPNVHLAYFFSFVWNSHEIFAPSTLFREKLALQCFFNLNTPLGIVCFYF